MSEIIKINDGFVHPGSLKSEIRFKSGQKVEMFGFRGTVNFRFSENVLSEITFVLSDNIISAGEILKSVLSSYTPESIGYIMNGLEIWNVVVTEDLVIDIHFDKYLNGKVYVSISPKTSSYDITAGEGDFLVWKGGNSLLMKHNGVLYKLYSTSGPDIHIQSDTSEYVLAESFDIPLLKTRLDNGERAYKYYKTFCYVIDNDLKRTFLWSVIV